MPIDETSAARVRELLLPHRYTRHDHVFDRAGVGERERERLGWNFVDAPPDVVAAALDLLDPSLWTGRGNWQAPAAWLVEQARARAGLLGGSVAPLRGDLRVDTICVPADQGADLARALVDAYPEQGDVPAAVDVASGHAWRTWQDDEPFWAVPARELLAGPPPGAAVAGLWWD